LIIWYFSEDSGGAVEFGGFRHQLSLRIKIKKGKTSRKSGFSFLGALLDRAGCDLVCFTA
jgi:hypothetical protein